jgi:hypothetical protein
MPLKALLKPFLWICEKLFYLEILRKKGKDLRKIPAIMYGFDSF